MKIVVNISKCKWKILFSFIFLLSKWIYLIAFTIAVSPSEVKCQTMNYLDPLKFMNENSTLVLPSTINTTQNSLVNSTVLNEELKILPWWCTCSGADELEEPECICEGPKLFQIPQNLTNITRLSIANSKFKVLKEAGLRRYASTLRDIILINLDELYLIESGAFKNIKNLRTIYISHAPRLQFIQPETFRNISHSFKSLRIIHSGLTEIPDLHFLSDILQQADFEGNQISEISENSIQIKTEQLIIDNNVLISIQKSAFNGSEIGKLSLKGNKKLTTLHEKAFEGIVHIQELDLSSTSVQSLPSIGLEKLEILRIQNTQSLKQIPSVYQLVNLEMAWLTHPFHCCAFKFPQRHDPQSHSRHLRLIEELKNECKAKGYPPASESMKVINLEVTSNNAIFLNQKKRKRRASESHLINISDVVENKTVSGSFYDESERNDGDSIDDSFDGEFHTPTIINNELHLVAMCGNIFRKIKTVQCYPKPDALNPCEDVMGSSWLRASVWIVVSLAVIGNVAVLVVLLSHRSEFTVPKFLICNLAWADLCMGIYLLLIASIDLHSMGEYFNFAFDWQYGLGCKTAGALTVFAGHLSIFTLTIITVERWFAITHAIYLNKRLKHRSAVYIMIGGWLYSILMAVMPLFGISNYSSTSICLPMEAQDVADVTYLITVLAVNGLGFFIVVVCYAQIYFSLGKETRQRNNTSGEMTVAKKMGLLVFTNFACWAPIAFFGLTALAGYPLIDVTKSKILLVFFYPLNSCANPYLYAILTAQYRRDLFLLLSKYGICTQRAQQYKMNYSNPTHTIPLNMISTIRNSNSLNFNYRRTNNMKSNTDQLLVDNNVNNECQFNVNGKTDNLYEER